MAPAVDRFWNSSGFCFAEPAPGRANVSQSLLFTLLALLPGPGVVKPVADLATMAGATCHEVIDVLVDAWLQGDIEFDVQNDTFFIRKQGDTLPTHQKD